MNEAYAKLKALEIYRGLILAGQTDFALKLMESDIADLEDQIKRYEDLYNPEPF